MSHACAPTSTSSGDAPPCVAAPVLRRLSTGDPEDASFLPGETTSFILAVWDGSAGDVNGRKSVTLAWTPLALDATKAADLGSAEGGR